MSQAGSREFLNTFPEYSPSADNKTSSQWRQDILTHVQKFLHKLEGDLQKSTDWSDASVYTGTAGIALLYLHLSMVLGPDSKDEYLQKAFPYVDRQLSSLKGRRLSFLCGDPGPIAIAAVILEKMGKHDDAKSCIKTLQGLNSSVLDTHGDLPDELLYGRVGYLYALLFIQKFVGEKYIDKQVIHSVVQAVVESGESLSRKERHASQLMYKWHDSYYLGAAHGVSGIMYMLLQTKDFLTQPQLNNYVRPTVDYLMGLQYPSGNYPSSLGSTTDKLVHWCHGAPGFIHMLCLSHKVFGGEKYLQAALKCGDVIWEKGLLKKGYGLCHGPAGNAYGFLVLYRITGDPKHLYRARKVRCTSCSLLT